MLKETKIILLLALLVGLIYIFPHIIYSFQEGPYNPLYISPGRAFLDESIYAAGVQEVLEGNFVPTDLVTLEHKPGPFIYGPFPFIVMALLTFCGGIVGAIILSDFLFAAFGFLLFYLLAKKLLASHQLALISSLVFTFWYRLFIPPSSFSPSGLLHHFTSALWNGSGTPVHFWFSRFVHPQIPLVLMLGTVYALYLALEQHKWRYYSLTALLLALNFYSYLYNWTYLLVFMGLLMLFTLLQRKKDWFLKLTFTLLVSLLLAVPYILNALALHTLDITARSGMEYGRTLETISLIYLSLAGVIISLHYVSRGKFRDDGLPYYFIVLFLISAFIVLNIQVILGYTIQNDHWNSRIIVPFLILTLFYLSTKIIPHFPQKISSFFRISSSITYFFVSILLIVPLVLHTQEAIAQKDNYSFSANEYELITYFQENTSLNQVVLSSNLTWNLWIPAYTGNNIYFPYGAATLAPNKEIEQRFITTYKLMQYSTNSIATQLHANSVYTRLSDATTARDASFQTYLRAYIFVDSIYPVTHDGIFKKRTYDSVAVESLIEKYNQTVFEQDHLVAYQIDYILLVGEDKSKLSTITSAITLAGAQSSPVFENDQFLLLKITNSS